MLSRVRTCIERAYGSRGGLVRHVYWRTMLLVQPRSLGSEIDWSRVERFVFLCDGNVCRSSLAEVQAVALGLNARSAGLKCGAGHAADPRAVELAERHGLDLNRHRTTPLRDVPLQPSDLIVAMEPRHLYADAVRDAACQVTLLGLWSAEKRPYIHDPYCCSESYFDRCGALVLSAVKGLAAEAHRI